MERRHSDSNPHRIAALLLALALAAPAGAAQESQPSSRPASPPPDRPFAEIASLPKPKAGAVRLFLARHGQSVGNASGDDPKISEKDKDRLTGPGKAEAAALGAAVKLAGVHHLWHSPARRAGETADLAWSAAGLGEPPRPKVLEVLRPLAVGTPPGGGSPLAWLVQRWRAGEDPRPPGGESLADYCKRLEPAAAALRALAAEAKEPVFAFCHSETLLAFYVGFDPAALRAHLLGWRLRNGGVFAFDLEAKGPPRFLGCFAPSEAK